MASIRKEIVIAASPAQVWDAMRDVGALHTRLVPGFVTDTTLERDPETDPVSAGSAASQRGGAGRDTQSLSSPLTRIVTFGNGLVAREPIVTIDDEARRLVWTAVGGRLTHYNAATQIFTEGGDLGADAGMTRVVWTADLLPDTMAAAIAGMIEQGLAAMKAALEKNAKRG